MHERDAIAEGRERLARDPQGSGVPIECDDVRRTALEQRARMPAQADGAVDEDSAARRQQHVEHFAHHHRLVSHRRQMPNSASALASSSV